MEKNELIKNKLDLEYNAELQKFNAVLIFMSTGILGFIVSFIWLNGINLVIGTIVTLVISILGFVFYLQTRKNMSSILNKIENL